LKSFETGVRYMMYHVLAMLFINSSSLLQEKSFLADLKRPDSG